MKTSWNEHNNSHGKRRNHTHQMSFESLWDMHDGDSWEVSSRKLLLWILISFPMSYWLVCTFTQKTDMLKMLSNAENCVEMLSNALQCSYKSFLICSNVNYQTQSKLSNIAENCSKIPFNCWVLKKGWKIREAIKVVSRATTTAAICKYSNDLSVMA